MPQEYIPTRPGVSGSNGTFFPARGVVNLERHLRRHRPGETRAPGPTRLTAPNITRIERRGARSARVLARDCRPPPAGSRRPRITTGAMVWIAAMLGGSRRRGAPWPGRMMSPAWACGRRVRRPRGDVLQLDLDRLARVANIDVVDLRLPMASIAACAALTGNFERRRRSSAAPALAVDDSGPASGADARGLALIGTELRSPPRRRARVLARVQASSSVDEPAARQPDPHLVALGDVDGDRLALVERHHGRRWCRRDRDGRARDAAQRARTRGRCDAWRRSAWPRTWVAKWLRIEEQRKE